MIMTALCVAFWATFLLVLVDHVSKQCLLYAVGCAIVRKSVRNLIHSGHAPYYRKGTKSLDNWTGILSHVGAPKSANPESGSYTKCGSVDSDIVDYVNRYEVDEDRMKTVKRTQKARPRTPLPPPFPQSPWRRPGLQARDDQRAPPLGAVDEERGEGRGDGDGDLGGPHSAVCGGAPKACSTPTDQEGTQEDDREDLNGGRCARVVSYNDGLAS
jgi:hypothetical protein